jgi:L-iditol 2-dehydrogenase
MFDIPKTMRAVVYRGVNDLRLETVPVPRIGADELLVKVAVCGVCPTDIKKIHYGTVPPPRIFGHETAGTIVKTGARVRGFRVGDRVGLHHHAPCMKCHACRHRSFAQCPQYKLTGITAGFEPAGGGYAEYVRVMKFVLPAVVKIPARNGFDEGAMVEPVNTVLKAVRRLNLLRGDNVLVAGQGPIGLMFTRLLKLQGVNVLATDLMESRLRLAKKLGAKWTFNPQTDQSGRAKVPHRPNFHQGGAAAPPCHGANFDAAIVAVPSDDAVRQALQSVRGAGQVLIFAHTKRRTVPETGNRKPEISPPPPALDLDLATICVDEKDLIGSYSSDFTLQREVARLIFSRQLDMRGLITHHFPLEQTAAAVALAARPTADSLKIIVNVAADPSPL